MSIVVEQVRVELVRPLRHAVLRPGRPFEEAVFGSDGHPEALHFAAYDGDAVVGVVSVSPEEVPEDRPGAGTPGWRIRGMAVAEDHRSSGVGGLLLEHALRTTAAAGLGPRFAEERGAGVPARVMTWCNARLRAVPFYERHGFTAYGPEFDAPGIGPHRFMSRVTVAP